jgi:hypothetical protein
MADMIRCIKIGTTTVQGTLLRELPDGRAQVCVGGMVYAGELIDQRREDQADLSHSKQDQPRTTS